MLHACTYVAFFIFHRNFSPHAAVQVQFDPQNYTVTEGNVVNMTLVTNTSDYMFNFTVTLQNMDGSAAGESFNGSFTRTLRVLRIQFIMKRIL